MEDFVVAVNAREESGFCPCLVGDGIWGVVFLEVFFQYIFAREGSPTLRDRACVYGCTTHD